MTLYSLTDDVPHELEVTIRERIMNVRDLVAVTGAGISKASGLPLGKERIDGIPVEDFFARPFLQHRPEDFFRLYRQFLFTWRKALPNAAHEALARRGVWVITQNIDGLHRDAGTTRLIELHGNLRELHCRKCPQIYGNEFAYRQVVPRCPGCNEVLQPGISFVGDEVRHFNRAVDWVGRAEVLFVVGTSLNMEPVRKLPQVAGSHGADVVWVNENAEIILPRLLSYV